MLVFAHDGTGDRQESADRFHVLGRDVQLIAGVLLVCGGLAIWLSGLPTAGGTVAAFGALLSADRDPGQTERQLLLLAFVPLMAGHALLYVGQTVAGTVGLGTGVAAIGVYLYREWTVDSPAMPEPDSR